MKLKRYPLNYNPIQEYYELIVNEKVKVSKKIKRMIEKLYFDLMNPNEYHYSHKRANHILEFAENFCSPSKLKSNKKLVLDLWEKVILASAFGFVDFNGNRKYNRVVLIIAKKNGKSLLASIVGLYMLMADGEAGPEVYSVATKKDQAKLIWDEAKNMVLKSPSLNKRLKQLVSGIYNDSNFGYFKALSSDHNKLDGLNIHCALLDEIHQWKNGKYLYDIIVDGIVAREQPLIFITSTAGTIREDIYDFLYAEISSIIDGYDNAENGIVDEHTLAFVYELDHKDEWLDESNWIKANPGLGTIKSYDKLKEKVEQALQNPRHVKNLLCKQFNVMETSNEAWLTFEEANNTNTYEIEKLGARYGIGGVDLSKTVDLTCATILFQVLGHDELFVKQMYFIPDDLLEHKEKEDKVPYSLWKEKGLLRTCPGNRIDYSMVTEWFIEIQRDYDIYIYKVGYDSWSAEYWVQEMENTFGKIMEKVQQTTKVLSIPMDNLKAEFLLKKINYNNHPILKWNLKNVSVEYDRNNNIKPIKPKDRTKKIDGFAALLDAFVVYENHKEEYLTLI